VSCTTAVMTIMANSRTRMTNVGRRMAPRG
jgi:hypothetical protein